MQSRRRRRRRRRRSRHASPRESPRPADEDRVRVHNSTTRGSPSPSCQTWTSSVAFAGRGTARIAARSAGPGGWLHFTYSCRSEPGFMFVSSAPRCQVAVVLRRFSSIFSTRRGSISTPVCPTAGWRALSATERSASPRACRRSPSTQSESSRCAAGAHRDAIPSRSACPAAARRDHRTA